MCYSRNHIYASLAKFSSSVQRFQTLLRVVNTRHCTMQRNVRIVYATIEIFEDHRQIASTQLLE